jgi:16S rRNA (uracil1498-N3)-methyltransferase
MGVGRLVRVGKSWEVELHSTRQAPRGLDLTLVVGAGDRDRFGWMMEKATELGATAVVPLESERTAGVATRLRAPHLERLRRQALEVLKQSGAAWVTRVDEPVSLADLSARPLSGKGWVAEASGPPVPAVLGEHPLTVVVGPEGGLTVGELDLLRGAGYRPVSLGPHTLRFETAAIVATAAAVAARLRGNDG